MSVATSPHPASAVVHPVVDALLIGGLSLFFFVPALFWPAPVEAKPFDGTLMVLTALVNSPHILSSFWLLYRSPRAVREHKVAAFVLPALLIALCAGSVVLRATGVFPGASDVLVLAMVLYTPIHFVGQAWGMMSVFSFLGGAPFVDNERRLLRGGLNLLIAWVMIWGAARHTGWPEAIHPVAQTVYNATLLLLPVALAVGAVGLWRYRSRVGGVPLRVLLPWVAIYVWYFTAARHPEIHPFIQIAHALQYLIFPMRVEMNTRADGSPVASAPERADPIPTAFGFFLGGGFICFGLPHLTSSTQLPWWIHAVPAVSFAGAAVCLVGALVARGLGRERTVALQRALAMLCSTIVLGCVGYWFVHRAIKLGLGPMGIDGNAVGVSVAVAAFLNVHHYFTDGVLWKLRNPEVRRALFLHVPRPAPGTAPAPAAAE